MSPAAPTFVKLKPFDIVGLLEAAHDVRATEQAWLEELLARCALGFASSTPMVGYTYRIDPDGSLRVMLLAGRNASPGLLETLRLGCHGAPREFIETTYPLVNCATLSELAERNDASRLVWQQFSEVMGPFGVRDAFGCCGCDAERKGVYLCALLGHGARTRSREAALMGQVGAHLAATFRLRRTLTRLSADASESPGGIEAVLTPGGKLLHAEQPAQTSTARALLQRAVQLIEKARGPMRRDDPDGAVARWKALVGARWTLIDSFESDGHRYVLARENRSTIPTRERLTERERQVLAHAQLGHTVKVIAYELGIADSTVRVLLHRAAAKLGWRKSRNHSMRG